jgi:hypothetical protein
MEQIVKRTGQPGLRFEGELLAESDGKWASGKEQNRWHNLRLFQTAEGKYLLAIEYKTIWEGELDNYWAGVADNIEELKDQLSYYEPTEHIMGFPPHPQYQERQANLINWIRRRFEMQISQIFDEAGLTEQI